MVRVVGLRARAAAASQAWLSSSAPIQISKLALIQEPGKMWSSGSRRHQRASASLTVTRAHARVVGDAPVELAQERAAVLVDSIPRRSRRRE